MQSNITKHNRPQFKTNWQPHDWQSYIDEALETARGLKKLGCGDESVARWQQIAVEREAEFKATQPRLF